jgi:hypothetical protein
VGHTIRKLARLLEVRSHRWIAVALAAVYEVIFLVSIRDITAGGTGFGVTVADLGRMFERTGAMTFEPVARVTLPGVTVLVAPVNVLLGAVLAGLVGLNLMVTYLAFRQPRACSFNRSTGLLASVPALLAGGACCAPTIVLILGLQMTSAAVTAFQWAIPVALLLLVATLKMIVDRTEPELIGGSRAA